MFLKKQLKNRKNSIYRASHRGWRCLWEWSGKTLKVFAIGVEKKKPRGSGREKEEKWKILEGLTKYQQK